MGEFELIQRYFAARAGHRDDVALGIGDDCALLQPPTGGALLATSVDTLVEGVHFLPGSDPARVARRLLGAAVSDLAAMGATPAWFTLVLTLPAADPAWLEPFAQALAERAAELEIGLVGGDTTRGPLTLSVQVQGWVEAGRALRRDAAQAGDLILVSGTLGDSRGGLEVQLQGVAPSAATDFLLQRFFEPQPRIDLARALAPLVHAGIDISDGLLADLGHIARRSGLRACIELERLPLSAALLTHAGETRAREWALSGGEDFELCLTAPAAMLPRCMEVAARQGVELTCIGRMEPGEAEVQVSLAGRLQQPARRGHDHFGGKS